MTQKKEHTNKRRTQVKELPKREQELSKSERKKIKGGPDSAFFLPSISRSGGNS